MSSPCKYIDFSDPKVFKVVYDTYWEKVYVVCYNHTQRSELAQGMVQDIFKSLWERRKEVTIEKSLEHYLLRSAKLKVFEHFRNEANKQKHLDRFIDSTPDRTYSVEEEVEYNELSEKIGAIVDQLPGQCKRVFQMSRQQGMNNKQIADQLEISTRAVEYHISKALARLKEHLASEYPC